MRPWPEFRQPLFVGAVLLHGLLQLNRRVLHATLPTPLTSYLADLLALPVLLTLALAAQRWLGPQPATFVFPDAWLLATWLGISVWFEALLPQFSAHAISDPFDVLAYALGTLAFRRSLNQPV
ncbi:MAG: magnesium citrate secondary transporter [Bacteroidota bacterium]|nr:magnesium citrate secondary transporter [Bacteroidota bacterium]